MTLRTISCTEFFTGVHLVGQKMHVPGTVLAEAGYLVESRSVPMPKPRSSRVLPVTTMSRLSRMTSPAWLNWCASTLICRWVPLTPW